MKITELDKRSWPKKPDFPFLLQVAKTYGTPSYVYDSDTISRQVTIFRTAFSGIPVQIRYAMKANSNINILKLMKKLNTGVDTVSVPEIHLALKMGFSPNEIVFTPNLVNFREVEAAIKIGTNINIENLSNLEKLGKKFGNSVPCFVRINPQLHLSDENPAVEAWHRQSKFGIDINQFEQVHNLVRQYKIRIVGLHLHSSHVIMSREVFLEGAQKVFALAKEFPNLKYLDFGGGLRPIESNDPKALDIFELGKLFKALLVNFEKERGFQPELWFEPGRFLLSEAGVLLVKAEILKTNGQIHFVGVNSGFNHLIRPMFYGSMHEIVNLSNPDGPAQTYTVTGNLCEIDNFAVDRRLPRVSEGDYLMIKNAGAYGFSMSSHYNSRFKPQEILILNKKAQLIRKKESINDLLRNQIEIDI